MLACTEGGEREREGSSCPCEHGRAFMAEAPTAAVSFDDESECVSMHAPNR
jgi:hypothetical protein